MNGLRDEPTDWLGPLLAEFSETSGLEVAYDEGHSRATAQKLIDEAGNPKSDVIITLPPFIHMSDSAGLLAPRSL